MDDALPGEEGGSGEGAWGERELAFMRQALAEAWRAYERLEVPVGCVVVRDGAVVARGSNRTNELRNGTRHAEFEAVDTMLAASGGDVAAAGFDRCELFVTCEPCIMCAGALSTLRFAKVRDSCHRHRQPPPPAAPAPSRMRTPERGSGIRGAAEVAEYVGRYRQSIPAPTVWILAGETLAEDNRC